MFLGTCYYGKALDYYTVTEGLFRNLRLPARNILESSSATVIRDILITLNAPALPASAIRIDMAAANRLKEIKICYDLKLGFTACI